MDDLSIPCDFGGQKGYKRSVDRIACVTLKGLLAGIPFTAWVSSACYLCLRKSLEAVTIDWLNN
jgi:hypothetical protein